MSRPDDNDHSKRDRGAWDRREFGKLLAAGLGALAAGGPAWAAGPRCDNRDRKCANRDWKSDYARPGLYPDPDLEPVPSTTSGALPDVFKDVDVVIVGAGLSGLIAARELTNAKKKVVVLEANDRIGGRMFGEAIPGGYVDYGGQWVGPTQYHMQDLVTELGIGHFLSYEEGRSIQSWNGNWTGFNGDVSDLLEGCAPPLPSQYPGFPVFQSCRPPHPQLPDCVHSEADGAVWQALLAIAKTVIPDRPWDTPNADVLDGQTFQKWLEGQRKLRGNENWDYKHWLSTLQSRIGGSGAFEPDEVSLLHMAWTQRVGPQWQTPEKWLLRGGAGQIPARLAEELKGRIVLRAPARAIRKLERGIRVDIFSQSEIWTVEASAAIVALPPSLRSRIDFRYPGADAYAGFGNESPMGSMAKVHAVYEDPFWRKACLSGSALGNLTTDGGKLEICQFIADSSLPEDDAPGVLTSFVPSCLNQQYPTKAAVEPRVVNDLVYFFGTKAGKPTIKYKNWDDELWVCGAFTNHLGPGGWTGHGPDGWRKPLNREIFWAGTETSDEWPGYFDGAIKAGQRAADEFLNRKEAV